MKGGKEEEKQRRRRWKTDKIEANTPQAFKPPNSTRAQKPHNQRKAPNPYKYTSAPQNALKTPLKREIEPYLKADAGEQKQESGQKSGRKGRNTPPETLERLHHLHQWTRWNTTTKGAHDTTHQYHISKICLDFAPFGLQNSRENTKAHQKFIHFCPFLPKICPDRLKIDIRRGWRQAGRKPLCYMQKGHKRGTPPPIGGAASALYPHNFSRHKNRKKFAQEDIIFRTKNTSKSQPALGWKKFRKKFAGKCFGGKRNAPNLVERGRGANNDEWCDYIRVQR